MTKIIGLDCDGVILDYPAAYKKVWEKTFGVTLEHKNPEAFHAFNQYGCPFKDDEQKKAFYEAFTHEHWADMPPLPDAYEACTKLTEAGYTLVCITSMPNEFTEARQANFRLHNLPIEKTIAVGRDRSRSVYNPKLDALLELAPEAFVDDYAANFMEMENTSIHKALIHRNQPDSPNTNIIHLADSVHTNLSAFVDFWLNKKELQERQKLKDWCDRYAPEDDCGSGYYEDSAYGCGGY